MANDKDLGDVLGEFARTMVTDFPIQGILDQLVQRIVDIMPITAAGVTLINPDLVPRYVAASDDSALRYEKLQTELGEGPCLMAYQSGGAVSSPDLAKDDRFALFGPRASADGLAAVWTFPLRQGDKRLGALDLYRDMPGDLDDRAMAVAQILADVTSAYLVNAQARADLEETSHQFRESSLHDALTGLPNRALLLERLEHALTRSSRSEKITAILYVDLDRFKEVNDAHGHGVGDDLLIAVAQRLRSVLRPGDTLARMSGDEFVVLCEDLDEMAQIEQIAARIVASLGITFQLPDLNLDISASTGIAFAGRGNHVAEDILHDADIAMNQAKRRGGGQSGVLDLRTQELDVYRHGLVADLRDAVVRGQLHNDYQPIVATVDGRLVGAEALVRWDHPTRGMIPPSVMVPLAESTGQICEIGKWVLERACDDRRTWREHGIDDGFMIAVNVSAQQLMEPTFVALVSSVLNRTHTPPGCLNLEVTEGVFLQDSQRALEVLDELKLLGVKISLDDFGTGYSSLTYLQQLPIDVIKIDRGFIANILLDRSSHSIVTKVVELAHLLDMAVVAEGVETHQQHEAMMALGSESCQGFYFARPMSAAMFEALIPGGHSTPLLLPVPT